MPTLKVRIHGVEVEFGCLICSVGEILSLTERPSTDDARKRFLDAVVAAGIPVALVTGALTRDLRPLLHPSLRNEFLAGVKSRALDWTEMLDEEKPDIIARIARKVEVPLGQVMVLETTPAVLRDVAELGAIPVQYVRTQIDPTQPNTGDARIHVIHAFRELEIMT